MEEKRDAENDKNNNNKIGYRYNALSLQFKGPAVPANVQGKSKPGPKRKRKQIAPKKQDKQDIYTAVRYADETEGTSEEIDIEDASLVMAKDQKLEEEEIPANNQKTEQKTNLLSALEEIAERQKERQRLQSLQRAALTETRPFTAHQVAKLNYTTDGKGNFYSDSCGAQCSFAVTFTVDGMRRLQFPVDINRHLLHLTQDQWKSFHRMLRAVECFEYNGWEKKSSRMIGGRVTPEEYYDDEDEGVGDFVGRGRSGGGGCCVIKRALTCLLRTTPKMTNVGGIKFSTCVGAKPVYLKRMPEEEEREVLKLNLTGCLDERILKRLEEEVEMRRGGND